MWPIGSQKRPRTPASIGTSPPSRMFRLGVKAKRVTARLDVDCATSANVRKGFFEREALDKVSNGRNEKRRRAILPVDA
jgi:hypothetical protein